MSQAAAQAAVPSLGRADLAARLLESDLISPEQVAEAQERMAEMGGRLVDHLREFASPEALMEVLSEQLALPIRTQIDRNDVDNEVLEKVSIAFAKEHDLLPLGMSADGSIRVAVTDPLRTEVFDDLRLLFDGADLKLELVTKRTLLGAINEVYDRGPALTDALAEDAVEDLDSLASEISQEPQDLIDSDEDDAPIVKLVNSLLHTAVKERASDVHIEPFESDVRVRFRIDDVLYEPTKPLPKAIQASLVSRVKIMGHLNIAEKRLPQDGRIRLKIAGADYDVRLSTLPVTYGERVVMRLLPRTQDLTDLEKLGFDSDQLDSMERLISRPNGIVLVTGPTGSGKTTTLYGSLARINTTDKNIVTIEDPVEIQLPGIGQIEVNTKVGLSFAAGLRSVLRQDPNVILVGEIRDLETAEIAIQASLTGHLVFSTLHTNDAASAITRLVDMGVEPFLVGSSLVAVLAQRLVRVLCTDCKSPHEATPEELHEIGIDSTHEIEIFGPEGCPSCNYTGYHGRLGIFELMHVDDDIRALVSQNIDSKTIRNTAMRKGMHTLRADGARKVLAGHTSVSEVLRATEEEATVAQI
ncbi:MAG: type II secretion system ATPase GspE [Myxococcales bacterium]|nr:type II secretion system ATPase GspE [Myxococcales bacterium]